MSTTYRQLDPKWHAFGSTRIPLDVPDVSQVLASKPLIRKPHHLDIDKAEFPLLLQEEQQDKDSHAEKIISAHILPLKFPVRAEDIHYPTVTKNGAYHPLYKTSSMEIGSKPPQAHQLPERFFPRSSRFSSSFLAGHTENTALKSHPSKSRIHQSLDRPY